MKLTNNFKLYEFIKSNTATKYNIPNNPGITEIGNLKALCENLLQPLRDLYKEPFIINSGYRCPELNKLIPGSSSTSQHVKGQAADVRVKNARSLQRVLIASDLEFDQAILYPTFLHLSYNKGKNRKQILYAKGVKPEQ